MAVRAGMGLSTYPFETINGFWQWVQLCEESDLDSIWQTDTLVSKEPMLECMSAMAALAGATKRLKFGMNVASVGIRDPLLLAKQCATIDVLSQGRLLPAFGIGSIHSADWRASGRPTKGRGRRTDEGLDIITKLWKGDSLNMHGDFYSYDGVQISPLPTQKPLPLWIGGSSEAAIKRTARVGTGWQAAFETPDEAGIIVQKIISAIRAEGRSIDEEHFGTGINFRFGNWDHPAVEAATKRFERVSGGRSAQNSFAVGDIKQISERVREFVSHGVIKFVMRPLSFGDADTLHQTRLLINELLPEIDSLNGERSSLKTAVPN